MNYEQFLNLEKKFHKNVQLVCLKCKNTFERMYKYIYISFKRNKEPSFFCSKECCKIDKGLCLTCEKQLKGDQKKFCSHSCSAKASNAGRIIANKPKRIKKKPKVKEYRKCACGVSILSPSAKYCDPCRGLAFQKGGCKAAKTQSETRRSKNEILFAELCSKEFSIETNECIFNGWDADVIIPSLKIAVLWNGKWHYEKITQKHSVLQVQNRDRMKIKEIEKAGYIPYVIKDMGKHNPNFVRSEFEKFYKIAQNLI